MADLHWQPKNSNCKQRDIYALVSTAEERQSALLAFIRAGITCGARVVLVGFEQPPKDLLSGKEGQVISLPEAALSLPAGETLLPADYALSSDGALMVEDRPLPRVNGKDSVWHAGLHELADAAGYSEVWLAVAGLGTEIMGAAQGLEMTVLHLYDSERMTGRQLLDALHAHTHILVNGEISENELYQPPESSDDPNGDALFAACYQRMVSRRGASQEGLMRDHAMTAMVSDAIALAELYPNEVLRILDVKGSIAGYTPNALINRLDYAQIIHEHDLPLVDAFYRRVVSGESGEVDFRLLGENDDFTWVRLSGRGVRIEPDGLVRLYLAARDIDWRKRTEIELAASYTALRAAVAQLDQANNQLCEKQGQLDLLLAQAPVQIWTTGKDLNLTSIMGTHDSASLPVPVLDMPASEFFGEDTPGLDSHQAALLGETSSFEISIKGRYYLARVGPLHDASGAVVGVIGVALDITEQQHAEETLLLTQAFNRSLLDASVDNLVLLNRKGCILALNGTAAEHLGRSVEALIGQPVVDQLPPDVGQALLNALSSVINSRKTEEHVFELGERVLRVRLDPIADPQGVVAQTALLVQDISLFLQAEHAERRRREVADILRSVSEDLTRTTHRKQVLRVVLDGIRWLAPELSAHVMMLKEGLAIMESYSQNASIRSLGDLRQMPPLQLEDATDLREMYKTQKPVLISDVRNHPEWVKTEAMGWIRSYAGAPIVIGSTVIGFITLASEHPNMLNAQHVEVIQALAGQAAVALQKAQMFTDLEEKNIALEAAYDATIAGWARALELRDKETEGHSQRVVALTMRLIEQMNLPVKDPNHIRWGALLHDIGKMGIPDNILLKSDSPLTDQEWTVMKMHPTLAYQMLSGIDYLRPALEIPYSHHEWWDGSGYPQGLAGDAIPLYARIFTVVDAWDALTNTRPYRPAWSPQRVARHIRNLAGSQFDPHVVDVFLTLLGYG